MGHGPSTKWDEDKSSDYKAKLGLKLFFLYIVVYGGFILISVINPNLMGADIGKINLAIFYGLGLIVFALILSFIYSYLCTKAEREMNKKEDTK